MRVSGRAGILRAGWVMPSLGSMTWPPLLTVAPTARAVTAKLGPPAPQCGQEGGVGPPPPTPSAHRPWAATRRTRPLRKGHCRAPTAPCLPSTAAFSRSGGSGLGRGGCSTGSQWCTQAGFGVPWSLGGLHPTLRKGIQRCSVPWGVPSAPTWGQGGEHPGWSWSQGIPTLTPVPAGLGELGGGGGAACAGQPGPGAAAARGVPAQEEEMAPEGLAQGNGSGLAPGAIPPASPGRHPHPWGDLGLPG